MLIGVLTADASALIRVTMVTKPHDLNNRKWKLALVDGSQLWRDLLAHIFRKLSDFEIIGVADDLAGLGKLLETVEVDWMVMSTSFHDSDFEEVGSLRQCFPHLRVLATSLDGSQVVINWMSPQEARMERATLSQLLAMMRSPQPPP